MKFALRLASVLLITMSLFAAQPATRQVLTLEIAKQVAAAAAAEAAANKWTVVITIIDEGGNLMYLERMDETQIGSIQVAQEKARSAVGFKRPPRCSRMLLRAAGPRSSNFPGQCRLKGEFR